MISYAQNGEDVVLDRLFRHQLFGHYVDVGAAHPTHDSVTKHFYDLGWRGINIEPAPREFTLLIVERPEDVNLAVGISDTPGTAELFVGTSEEHGLSTMEASVAQTSLGDDVEEVTIDVTTLAAVCKQYVTGPIDFMKIDVEGAEERVIRGGDWRNVRPRVLLVESTLPNSNIPSHAAWEPVLLAAGYRHVLFDGLNRFYAQSDDAEAIQTLSVPANILDGFVRHDFELAQAATKLLSAQVRDLGAEASRLRAELELERARRTPVRRG